MSKVLLIVLILTASGKTEAYTDTFESMEACSAR